MKESERSFVESEESGVATCNETKPAISISAEISSAYNLAMQQNFVPLIGGIRLTNSGNYPSDKIKLSFTPVSSKKSCISVQKSQKPLSAI